MHLTKKIMPFILCLMIFGTMASWKEVAGARGKLSLHIQHFVGNKILNLDSVIYKNEFGQPYSISKLKYYISNVNLTRKDGKEFLLKEYFLVNEEEQETKQIVLQNIPEGEYTSISFLLGVDSQRNCSGAQSGALDPSRGMFWMWNTGYIFLKIEGHSPASKSPGNIFEFHIGGYKAPNNCIRNIHIDLTGKNINIISGKNTTLRMKADASEIFKSPTPVDFSKISSVTDFHNAATIANNYTDMFSVL